MKNIKSILVILFVTLFSNFALGQSSSKVITIVNKADWCSICKVYAGRTVETFTKNNIDNYFQFIVNDITSNETRKSSKPSIVKAGISKSLQDAYGAGVLSFYDAKTKKLLAQVTVANTPEEVTKTMEMVREKISKI
jgi:hypothetical protein